MYFHVLYMCTCVPEGSEHSVGMAEFSWFGAERSQCQFNLLSRSGGRDGRRKGSFRTSANTRAHIHVHEHCTHIHVYIIYGCM